MQARGLHRPVALASEDLRQEPVAMYKQARSKGVIVHAHVDLHLRHMSPTLNPISPKPFYVMCLKKHKQTSRRSEHRSPSLELRDLVRRIHVAGLEDKRVFPPRTPG